MVSLRNASDSRRGFNYQDIVALYYYLDNIKEIKELNNEGEDDVDIRYVDGSLGFLQVKESKNVDYTLKSEVFKKALMSLIDDYMRNDNIKFLGIVTNNNYPLTRINHSFIQPYSHFEFLDLPQESQKRIKKQLHGILSSNKRYKNINFDENKLTITKISYVGSNDKSRLQSLREVVHDFMGSAGIPEMHYSSLLGTWLLLFSRNSEYPEQYISKQKFICYTEMSVMDSPDLDKFFREFDIKVGNKDYIRQHYKSDLERAIVDYTLVSVIGTDFYSYNLLHSDKNESENLPVFVNMEYKKVCEKFGFTKAEDADIAKLIIWLIVTKDTFLKNIEGASISNENSITNY